MHTQQARIERLRTAISQAERDGAWLIALEEMARAFQARSAQVYAPPFLGRASFPFLLYNMDFSAIAHKIGSYAYRAPFLTRAMERGLAPGVFTDRELIPMEELQEDDYYHEILVPFRWLDALQFVVRAPSSSRAGLIFSFYRFIDEEPFGADELHSAQVLLPQLDDATRHHFQAPIQEVLPPQFRLLDGFSTPCVVVSASRECLHANPAAKRLLKQGHGLSLRSGTLNSADARGGKLLAEAILRAADNPDGEPEEILLANGGTPLLAIVSPLTSDDTTLRYHETACAAIYLIHVESESQYAAQGRRAQLLFNLTGAETEVLEHFLSGRTLRDIASRRNTATLTVRTQLKAIMQKTHSRHQLDLLRFRRLAP